MAARRGGERRAHRDWSAEIARVSIGRAGGVELFVSLLRRVGSADSALVALNALGLSGGGSRGSCPPRCRLRRAAEIHRSPVAAVAELDAVLACLERPCSRLAADHGARALKNLTYSREAVARRAPRAAVRG